MEEDSDSLVIYGNALPPLEEENASAKKMKPTPIEEQIATDENGRRRFHGAFTGGFSAGFFNTAGSRDGWTPKHFKSSRTNRVGQQPGEQRPEDFMDDEDMGEFGIAHRKLQTSKDFNADVTKKRKQAPIGLDDTPIPGDPVLEQYIRPAQETIGVRLLKEMGWKPGQGIGPKLVRKRKKDVSRKTKALFGRASSNAAEHSDNDDDEDVDERYKDFLFAPDDIPNFVAKPKENLFGIAYKGLDRGSVLGANSSHINLFGPGVLKFDSADKAQKGRKLKITGQAFGVGAYEEEDDDIYQRDDMSRYDFALEDCDGGKNDNENSGKHKGKKSRWDKDPAESLVICLEGFVLAKKSSTLLQKKFDPPDIPKGFQPKGLKKSRFEPQQDEQMPTSNPTPDQRRLAISTESEKAAFNPEEAEVTEAQIKEILSSTTEDEPAMQFKPFASDPGKQKRYEQFMVCLKNGRKNALPILQPKDMPEWERDRERIEFERASMLFRPLNFSMSSRFISAGTSEEVDGKSGKTEEKELSESEKAVKMKLYGNLTREVLEWHPARLLCVRFNVKPPFADGSVVGVAVENKSKFDLFGRLNVVEAKPQKALEVSNEMPQQTEDAKISAATENDIITEEKEEAILERPPIDLFKSIFLASDSESEPDASDEEDKNGVATAPEKNATSRKNAWEKVPENSLRNPAPARGIFANIDFDRLNKKKSATVESPKTPPRMAAKDFFSKPAKASPEIKSESNFFGPRKPEEVSESQVNKKLLGRSEQHSSDDDDGQWVEKKEKSASKKKKKHHHKTSKKKKKSSKKKKKKKKERSSSSEDSSD